MPHHSLETGNNFYAQEYHVEHITSLPLRRALVDPIRVHTYLREKALGRIWSGYFIYFRSNNRNPIRPPAEAPIARSLPGGREYT